MLTSWTAFLPIYLLIGSIPSIILAIRGFGWRPRTFIVSQLVTWTGGGWIVMVWIAMLEKHPGFSLYSDGKPVRDPHAE
jgi:hypothetical protein